MWDGKLVIDAVAHAYDRSSNNRSAACSWNDYRRVNTNSYRQASALEPARPGAALEMEAWTARWSGDVLAETYFLESPVDIVIHHHVHIPAFFNTDPLAGASRWDEGVRMKQRAPDRVVLYGGVDSFHPDRSVIFESMAKMAEEGAAGFKFYPTSGFFDRDSNAYVVAKYDDPESAYPLFEKARALGVRHLAFHKAQPIGPGPLEVLSPMDLTVAAASFPDMTFEVVHDGWTFLEESALQLRAVPNIYANLEIVANLVTRQPLRFAHILGTLLRDGAADRILFATGCGYNHPAPIVDGIIRFSMPEDLVAGLGYPQVTDAIKAGILGGNAAQMLGINAEQVAAKLVNDEWAVARDRNGLQEPWSHVRAHVERVGQEAGGGYGPDA